MDFIIGAFHIILGLFTSVVGMCMAMHGVDLITKSFK